MCGIVAYLGLRDVLAILLAGLKRLEYRGYDSAGVAVIVPDSDGKSALRVVKKQGKVTNLESSLAALNLKSTIGIGHTRWATHGAPSDTNAHPHTDTEGTVAVVHNGIIENFSSLKKALMDRGIKFRSETDTELLAHLISEVRKKFPELSLENVVRVALQPIEGAFGIAVLFADSPDVLIGARHGSPLLIGVGEGEYFLASDASAVVEYTQTVEYLAEREMVTITRHGYSISSIDLPTSASSTVSSASVSRSSTPQGDAVSNSSSSSSPASSGISFLDSSATAAAVNAVGAGATPIASTRRHPQLQKLELSLDAIEKGGYKHFMLKEIMEQPRALRDAMRGRVSTEEGVIRLGGLAGEPLKKLTTCRRIIIAACGTSFHSGQVGEYLIETLARIPVEVEYASEFRYRRPILNKDDDVVIVISQSGETADTLAAVREAKANGVMTIGLVNVVGSSIGRETDAGCYLHVGPEIGVASTKAFSGQVLLLTMLALVLAKERGVMDAPTLKKNVLALAAIPDQMTEVLSQSDKVFELAKSYRFASSFIYLGRGFNFPVALEGALKLKEVSYIHAEGYAAAEMKHGPLALIDKFMPVVMIAPASDPVYDKIRSNVEEVLARGGSVVAIVEAGDKELQDRCDAVLTVPKTEEWLSPLLTVVPLQLLAYFIADLRKCNVDQPRNLAKSVTVE